MKNFFKNLFKKTYPERVNEDPAKTKIVYAGPPKGLRRKERMVCVYAGPGMMGQMKRRRDSEMEDVYAGPPMPEDIDEPNIAETEDIEEPEITEPEDTEESEITEKTDNTEVAGDTDMSDNVGKTDNTENAVKNDPEPPKKDPRMYSTMMVYAGPAVPGPARMSDDNVPTTSSNTDNGTPQNDNEKKTDGN